MMTDPGDLDMDSSEADEGKGKGKEKEATTILTETPMVHESEFQVVSSAENTYQGPTRGNLPWQNPFLPLLPVVVSLAKQRP